MIQDSDEKVIQDTLDEETLSRYKEIEKSIHEQYTHRDYEHQYEPGFKLLYGVKTNSGIVIKSSLLLPDNCKEKDCINELIQHVKSVFIKREVDFKEVVSIIEIP